MYRCEVDPHCCCAELGTDGPIRVDFEQATAGPNSTQLDKPKDYQYFNEEELIRLLSDSSSRSTFT